MKKLLTFILFLTASSATIAAESSGWNCINADLEVNCNVTKCEVEKNHTPMDVYVNATKMSICAYTGCWEGVPTSTIISGSFETFTGKALPFTTNPDSSANISVTVNRTSRIGMILVEGMFANPAICTLK